MPDEDQKTHELVQKAYDEVARKRSSCRGLETPSCGDAKPYTVPGNPVPADPQPAGDLSGLYMLDPEYTFLNNGSFGAVPIPVFERYLQFQRELEAHPAAFLKMAREEGYTRSRSALAEFLGTDVENLALITNVTAGMNVVARSMRLKAGDEVLSTDQEYGSINGAWNFVAHRRGFSYINHPVPVPFRRPEEVADAFWQGVTPRTRVIAFSHITSLTALTLPARLICKRAREAGILTVVDGAHAPAQIPLNLDDIGADFYCGNLHKWAGGPKGTAFLYARPEVQDLIEPLVAGGKWRRGPNDPPLFVGNVQNLGTRDPSRFLVIPTMLEFLREHNWPAVRARCHELVRQVLHRLCELSGKEPLADGKQWYSQMAACPLPTREAKTLRQRLFDEYKIETTAYVWNDHPLIRISIQAYNNQADIERFMEALKALL